jgi:hypothetical protein
VSDAPKRHTVPSRWVARLSRRDETTQHEHSMTVSGSVSEEIEYVLLARLTEVARQLQSYIDLGWVVETVNWASYGEKFLYT